MRIVIAPDSFKGSLTAEEAAQAMARGVRRAAPDAQVYLFPMADGGEGTLDVLLRLKGGRRDVVSAFDPLGRPIEAAFGWLTEAGADGTRTAVVELAAASGLGWLAPSERTPDNALRASTYGTGELLRAALDGRARRIYLTLGGSATSDGGFGLLAALGARYFDSSGEELSGKDASDLARVQRIDLSGLHPGLAQVQVIIASDVANPLCGPEGAAAVYGPQKGLDAQGVAKRDGELRRWAELLAGAVCDAGWRTADPAAIAHDVPGLGAAGGAGLPLWLIAGARWLPGARWVAEAAGLAEAIADADLVLTGEGRTDGQSSQGKVPSCVARLARAAGVRCVVVSGALGPGYEALQEQGATGLMAASPPEASEADIRQLAGVWLEEAAAQAVRVYGPT